MDPSVAGSGGGGNKLQVGVGIAINVVNATNTADVGQNDKITAKGLTLEAMTTNSSGTTHATLANTGPEGAADGTSSFGAVAMSGASDAGSVGVAGSLALNLVLSNTSEAIVKPGAVVTLSGGDVSIARPEQHRQPGRGRQHRGRRQGRRRRLLRAEPGAAIAEAQVRIPPSSPGPTTLAWRRTPTT